MLKSNKKMIFIKSTFWIGIAADAFWAVALLVPSVFGLILSNPDFIPICKPG